MMVLLAQWECKKLGIELIGLGSKDGAFMQITKKAFNYFIKGFFSMYCIFY